MKTLRIFISSPGDVADERDRARKVVDLLRKDYAGHFDLRAVLWEDLPLQADMSFQQGIDIVLSQERGIDIAVFILWSRLGSPIGPLIRKPDGSAYRSGTERELHLMLTARSQSQTDTPKILVYVRQDDASFDERLRNKPLKEKSDILDQMRSVHSFIEEEFHDATTNTNIRAYHRFDYPVTFSQRLRMHLKEILDPLASGLESRVVWDIATKGSPFRGLEAFQFEHSAVFCGREDEVLEVLHALQQKARDGCAFVLISGASGSGKSSLARAGVLPAIVEHELDNAVAAWRWAVCTPSHLGSDLCGGLAGLLCSDAVLPELRLASDSAALLAEGFAQAPKQTVDQSVRPALTRAAQGNPGAVRLCLLVDQLEELFADKRLTNEDRERFAAALESLARSGTAWVLATLRSDFYQHCQQVPALIRMKEGHGQIDLLPPTADALRRLIEYPAKMAGLKFEQRGGTSLADRILRDASASPELLPLLSYLLRELFEQRTGQGALTFAAYEQLGGVEGALARRAETIFTSLPNAAQHELGPVLRALISVSGDEEESVVRQRIPLMAFPPESPARMLIDRFVNERFLVTDIGTDGNATLAVAHEALSRVWPRAAQWVADNREFLRVRARVASRMKEDRHLSEDDPLLELARFHLAGTPAGFTPEQRAFIETSASRVQQAKQRRVRRLRRLVAAFATLAVTATVAGVLAMLQSAQRQRLLTEAARSDRFVAREDLAENSPQAAFAHLRRAMHYQPASTLAPEIAVAELNVWQYPPPRIIFQGHTNAVDRVQFSPDGKRIITASADKTDRIWNTTDGQLLFTFQVDQGSQFSPRFSPDGTRVVTASGLDLQVWNAQTGKLMSTLHGNPGSGIFMAQFSPDAKWIVTATGNDNLARVWNVQDGTPVAPPLQHGGWVWAAEFSPDGQRIVTACRDDHLARIWDVKNGKVLELQGHSNSVNSAHFSPDGKFVLTASDDGTARLWDAQNGELQRLFQHSGALNNAQFSPDGQFIVTASDDNTAQIWNAQNGNPVGLPLQHQGWVLCAEFSRDGQRVLTASKDKTACVWNAKNGELLLRLQGHQGVVNDAHFSPGDQSVVTASDDQTARLWDAQTNSLATAIQGHEDVVSSAQFSHDGNYVVTASWDKTARVWDARNNQLKTALRGHKGFVRSAQFSPDNRLIATASDDKTARVWDAQNGNCLLTLQGHGDIVHDVQFSLDGRHIVTASWDKTARVWDAQSGKLLLTLQGHDDVVNTAAFSPDGQHIVTASWDKTARVWSTQSGQLLIKLPHEDNVNDAQFSPDGRYIVTACHNKNIYVWDAQSGKQLVVLQGHLDSVQSAKFSPDGRRIVTASLDKTACVWDPRTGELLGTYRWREQPLEDAEFSPNGQQIVTASWGNTASLWTALPPSAGPPPAWFEDFLDYMAQQRLDSGGKLEMIPAADLVALRQRLLQATVEASADNAPYLRILRFFIHD